MKTAIFYIMLIAILAISTSFHLYSPSQQNAVEVVMCSGKSIKGLVFEKNEELEKLGTCYGYANCTACRNCSRCGYCNSGGSCGVCTYRSYKKPAPKKNSTKVKIKPSVQKAIDYNNNNYNYSNKLLVERMLDALNYYVGEIDGVFDSYTIAAIKKFQKSEGLTPDGKVGKITLKKLNAHF